MKTNKFVLGILAHVDSGKTTFYFDNTWNNITDDILKFTSSGEKGFHLFI